MRIAVALLCFVSGANAQWVMATATNPAVLRVAPDVHSVRTDERFVYVESAGLSLHSFGALQANQYDAPLGPRMLKFRIPREPKSAISPLSAPLGIIGVFVTGVPIYNPIRTNSYQDQGLWHQDAVAASTQGKAALDGFRGKVIGYALDGYPIYGPSGLRSGYRLRKITKRDTLPDGTLLTPGQEGPPVNAEYPPGYFAEDYEYVEGSGDLDVSNGRLEQGAYGYHLTETWPYLVGLRYHGEAPLEVPVRTAVQHSGPWTDRLQIEANQPVRLTLDFKTRFLERVHEKPVHLIVVSKDMAEFDHIHLEPVPGDLYAVTHTFARAGGYWVYADYTAPGEPPRVERFSLSVTGAEGKAVPFHSDTDVAVSFSGPLQFEANQDVSLAFTLTNKVTGQPIADLEPWLGAWGHIMIVREDGENFIHAHPLESASAIHSHTAPQAGPSPFTIRTQTGFREPGVYRVWFQFQRYGEINTVPFTITIVGVQSSAVAGSAQVRVSRKGFTPSRIEVPAGRPSKLSFLREDAQNCGSEIVFPSLGIRKRLPVGQTVFIDLPALEKGQLSFGCGMGMYKGALVVR